MSKDDNAVSAQKSKYNPGLKPNIGWKWLTAILATLVLGIGLVYASLLYVKVIAVAVSLAFIGPQVLLCLLLALTSWCGYCIAHPCFNYFSSLTLSYEGAIENNTFPAQNKESKDELQRVLTSEFSLFKQLLSKINGLSENRKGVWDKIKTIMFNTNFDSPMNVNLLSGDQRMGYTDMLACAWLDCGDGEKQFENTLLLFFGSGTDDQLGIEIDSNDDNIKIFRQGWVQTLSRVTTGDGDSLQKFEFSDREFFVQDLMTFHLRDQTVDHVSRKITYALQHEPHNIGKSELLRVGFTKPITQRRLSEKLRKGCHNEKIDMKCCWGAKTDNEQVQVEQSGTLSGGRRF